MVDSFSFRAKQTSFIFHIFPLNQVISSRNLVISKQPQKRKKESWVEQAELISYHGVVTNDIVMHWISAWTCLLFIEKRSPLLYMVLSANSLQQAHYKCVHCSATTHYPATGTY
jgi:hypothetical protein